MSKPKRRSRTKSLNKRAVNTEHLTPLFEKVFQQNLQLVKEQNRDHDAKQSTSGTSSGRKRRRNTSSENEGSLIAKKCFEEWLVEEGGSSSKPNKPARKKAEPDSTDHDSDDQAKQHYKEWRRDEYDSYNIVNRKTVLSKIKQLEKFLKPNATGVIECGRKSLAPEVKIMWSSPMFIVRYVRKCILRHEWGELAHLLLLLLKHNEKYSSFAREIAFLTALMSVDKCDSDLLEDLELCFVTDKFREMKEFDVWYVQEDRETTAAAVERKAPRKRGRPARKHAATEQVHE